MADVDAPARTFQHERMPTVINGLRGYRLLFLSCVDAKCRLQPFESASRFATHRHEIERKWHEHFSRED